MAKIKFTKGELKKQRDSLKQFEHYLPILQLKKQQLQLEIHRIHRHLSLKLQEIDDLGCDYFLNHNIEALKLQGNRGRVTWGQVSLTCPQVTRPLSI